MVWRLHAAALGAAYPAFGEVSVETAGLPAPAGLERTLPSRLTATAIVGCVRRLAPIPADLSDAHGVDGIAGVIRSRIATDALGSATVKSGS